MAIALGGAACVFPLLGLVLGLVYFEKQKKAAAAALICGLAFAAAFYGYVADEGNDIYRHVLDLQLYRDVGFFECFDRSRVKNVFTWDIWLWLAARFNDGNLLKASGACLGYGLASYMVFDYIKRAQITFRKWLPAVLLVYAVMSPASYAVGIRNGNSFMLFAYAVYRYYVRGKKHDWLTILLLPTAVFLHHATVVAVAAWVVFPLFHRYPVVFSGLLLVLPPLLNNFELYARWAADIGGPVGSLLVSVFTSAVNYSKVTNLSLYVRVAALLNGFLASALLLRVLAARLPAERKSDEKWVAVRLKGASVPEMLTLFAFLILLVGTVLLANMGMNGDRYFGLAAQLLFVPLVQSLQKERLLASKRMLLWDLLLLSAVSANTAIRLYNLTWGTASARSLFCGWICTFIAT